MWFTFKRIYFKIYHLLRFLSCFLLFFFSFISFCFADVEPGTSSCSSTINLLPSTFINDYRVNNSQTVGSTLTFSSRTKSYISYYVEVESSSTYTYSSNSTNTTGLTFYFVDSNYHYLSNNNARIDLDSSRANLYTFTTPNNAKYVLINAFASTVNNTTPSDWNVMIQSGSFTSYVPYSECSSPVPDNNSSSGSIYSSFVGLYVDRFNYLATGFTTNPYLLAMLGIIFSFVVLELLLHLIHIKGGYKK